MTDTMYNPASEPYISHFEGNRRIFEYIERFVCPTTTSDCVLGGSPFTFAGEVNAATELEELEAALVLKESNMASAPTTAASKLVARGEGASRAVWTLHELARP